jgi:hypothetical protein
MAEHSNPTTPVRPQRNNRNVAYLLIGAGIFIFIYTSGILNEAVWSVILPLGMVAVGLDLITEGRQRRRIGTGVVLAALVCVPLVAGSRLIERDRPIPPSAPRPVGRDDRRMGIEGVGEIDSARINAALNAAELRIGALDDDSNVIAEIGPAGELRGEREGRLQTITVQPGDWENREHELLLTPRRPLDLTLNLTAVDDSELDLSQLDVRSLNLRISAGEAGVTLPEQGVIDADIAVTAGELRLDIPDDLPARIEITRQFGEIDLDDRFEQQGDVYVTEDYDEAAEHRATIRLNVTGGGVEID